MRAHGHVVGAAGEGRRVGDHGRAARGVGAAVEHDAGVARRAGGRRAWPRARTPSAPGGGARGRRTTPRASRPSSPGGRSAAPASPRAPASRGPRGPPKAPPTPARCSRTSSGGRPRLAATWPWSTWSHWVARCRSMPPSCGGHAEGRLRAEEGLVLHAHLVLGPHHHVGRRAGRSPWRIRTRRSRLPPGCSGGAPGARAASALGERRLGRVVDGDEPRRPAGGLGVVGGHDRHGLALVAHPVRSRAPAGRRSPCRTSARPGTSSWVSTARTPGTASAAPVSIPRMRALGCGLRSVAPQSIPSRPRSDA